MTNPIQNRKLVRPKLSESKVTVSASRTTRKKQTPPEKTHAENFYYLKQMNNRTPITVVLSDGEILNGYIEWYDKMCIKLNRDEGPNLLLMKSSIKYLFKSNPADEDTPSEIVPASSSRAEQRMKNPDYEDE